MVQLIIPNTVLVSIRANSGGQDIVNVIGVTGEGAEAIAAANAVETAWKVAGGPLSKLSTSYQLKEIKAMELENANGHVHTKAVTGAGTLTGALATNASCALVTFGTGTRSKSSRGRMYFGPLREGDIDVDGRTLSAPTGFTTAFEAFRTSLNSNPFKWCVISRKYSTVTEVVTLATQSIIATQRRRIR